LKAIAEAPGKAILFGEHFVVMGAPAIAAALNLKVRVEAETRDDRDIKVESSALDAVCLFTRKGSALIYGESSATHILTPVKLAAEATLESTGLERGVNLKINSSIPVAVGLGSSAATAVATIGAISQLSQRRVAIDEVCNLAYASEKHLHGNPSGIDQTVSAYGGIIQYSRGAKPHRIEVVNDLPFVIGNTGIRRCTGILVGRVDEARRRDQELIARLKEEVTEIALEGMRAIKSGDLDLLGQLMNQNHELLRKIGVSNTQLDRLVKAVREAGALGAKLTGAGGGGCIIALTKADNRPQVAEAIRRAGGIPMLVEISKTGLRTWME